MKTLVLPSDLLVAAQERFWSKVSKAETCWTWNGYRDPNGYGKFPLTKRIRTLAHRVSYELSVGPIEPGLTIDHLCKNPGCVNPSHLEVVPAKVNALRGDSPATRNSKRTHCIRGHEFTTTNTYTRNGHRACRTCDREKKRRLSIARRSERDL